MATYINVTFGSPRLGGGANLTISRSNAVAGDMSVVITNANNVKSAGALLAAVQSIARDLQSDKTLS